jgi:hypothetical protein
LAGEGGANQDELSTKDVSGAAVTKVEKVHLEWQQLCCTYNAAGGKIVVLDNIWGQATPGEMQVGQILQALRQHDLVKKRSAPAAVHSTCTVSIRQYQAVAEDAITAEDAIRQWQRMQSLQSRQAVVINTGVCNLRTILHNRF